ncbi:hypothetical protein MUU54_22720 [Rhizobium tarimense]|nr:hypothetical protein [Pseudorhizobium tarimense]
MLLDAFACRVRIAMPHDYSLALSQDRFDLLLIDANVAEDNDPQLLIDAKARGAGLVFTTLANDAMDALPQFKGSATVAKPFRDEDLIRAVTDTLSFPKPEAEY